MTPVTAAALSALVSLIPMRQLTGQALSWSTTFDAAGEQIYTVFTEPSVRFGRDTGVQPVISLGAYYVVTTGANSLGLAPAVGIRHANSWGSVMVKVGWGRSSTTVVRPGAPPMMMSRSAAASPVGTAVPPPAASTSVEDEGAVDHVGGQSGLLTSLLTDFHADRAWGLQGIASYSWGAGFLWSRARVARRAFGGSSGNLIALGGELVWEVEPDDENRLTYEYQAIHLGPVVQVARSSGTFWAVSGGLKQAWPRDESTWYGKIEITIDP